jgi:hypothetical protein
MAFGASIQCKKIMLPYARHILAVLALCVAESAFSLSYSGLPFSGRVVDADTKEPMDGVIVVASWELQDRHGTRTGILTSTEAVTAKDGRFSMPAWGPIEVTSYENGLSLRMDPNQPALLLFKPGYAPGQTKGTSETYYLSDPLWEGDRVRSTRLDGRTIPLRRWTQSDANYNWNLTLWRTEVPLVNGCGWTRAPRMTVALIREGERFKNITGRNEIFDPDDLREYYRGQYCGPTKPILDEALR